MYEQYAPLVPGKTTHDMASSLSRDNARSASQDTRRDLPEIQPVLVQNFTRHTARICPSPCTPSLTVRNFIGTIRQEAGRRPPPSPELWRAALPLRRPHRCCRLQ